MGPSRDRKLLNQLSILNHLIQQSEINKFSEKKSVILVIGNTGAGKSRTVDELMPSKEHFPTLKRPKVGKDLDGSQTVIPELYEDGKNPELLYFDTPGFEHTDPDEKAAVSLLMQSLIQRHNVRGMLVVVNANALFLDHGSSLIKLLKTLSLLFAAHSQIEKFCIFSITHLSSMPPSDPVHPNVIHSMDNLEVALNNFSSRFSKELKRKKARSGELPDESTHDLVAKISMFNMLQNAIRDRRVVLTNYDTIEQQVLSCSLLREQFSRFPNGANLNDAFDFEHYDQERAVLMQSIEAEVAQLLKSVEYEGNLLKQYAYALEIFSIKKNQERAIQLESEINEKQVELAKVTSHEVSLIPFWSKDHEPIAFWDKKIFGANPGDDYSFVYGEGGKWNFGRPDTNMLPPVAKVKLYVKKIRSESLTLLAAMGTLGAGACTLTLMFDLASGGPAGSIAGLVITTLGIATTAVLVPLESAAYGVIKLGEYLQQDKSSQFINMRLGRTYQTLEKVDWEQLVELSESPTPEDTIFSVDFKKGGQWHWYTEVPTVEVFVRNCDIPSNQERAEHLACYIPLLLEQLKEVEAQLSLLTNISTARQRDQESLELQEQILKNIGEIIKPHSKAVKDNIYFIMLVTRIFSALNIPCHPSIDVLSRYWAERKDIITSIQCLDAIISKSSDVLGEKIDLQNLVSDYDTQVWYDETKVNHLLRHYLGSSPNIHILNALTLHCEQDITSELISNHLGRALTEHPDNQLFYAPIVINDNHWIGLYINKTFGEPIFYWLDPLEVMSVERQEQVIALLNRAYLSSTEITIEHVNFLPDQLQYDTHNCGPWVVEILRYLMSNGRLPLLGDIDIDACRNEHRQLLNVSAPNLSTQRVNPIFPNTVRNNIQTMFGYGYKFVMERQKDTLSISVADTFSSLEHHELLEDTEREFIRLIKAEVDSTAPALHHHILRGNTFFIEQLNEELDSINAQKHLESTGGCTIA